MVNITTRLSKISICALGIICAGLISCASTPKATEAPDWFTDRDSEFPDSKYIARIGEGFNKTESLADAEVQLGKYFGFNVKSTVSGSESWSGNDEDGYTNNKNLNDEFEITFDTELFAVEKTKPWYNADTETYFICAYIDRSKAFEMYKPTLLKTRLQFAKLYKAANDEIDFFKKVNLLKSAQKAGDIFIAHLDFAQLIKKDVYSLFKQDVDAVSNVQVLLKQAQNNAAIKVSVNDDFGSKLYDFVSKVVSDNGFIVSNNKNQYVINVDLDNNKLVDSSSGIISITPSLTINLENNEGTDSSFTYTRNFETFKAFHEETVEKKAWAAIEAELKDSFDREFKNFLKLQ